MKLSELVEKLARISNPPLACGQTAPTAIERVASSLSHRPHLDPDLQGVAAIDQAAPGILSFVDNAAWACQIDKTQASALILPCDPDLQTRATARGLAWLITDQPRYLFAQAIACFYQPWSLTVQRHPSAVIDPTARIGEAVAIGAHAVIHSGVQIGNGVQIHPNVVIYPGVTIGDRTILHANCVIHERTIIGVNCVIHSGAVIGAEGFGYIPTPYRSPYHWYHMPQSGRTILADQVVVGCNTTIDRPAVGDTYIGAGTKIDNLVQIGHGCQVGADSLICAQTGLAGATRLGQQVVLAGQVGISGQVELGDRTIVAAQSGVHQSLTSDARVAGYPAMEQRLWLRVMASIKKLPQLWQRVKALERQVAQLSRLP